MSGYSFQGSNELHSTNKIHQGGDFGDVNLGANSGGRGISPMMLGIVAVAAVIGIFLFKRKH